MALTSGGTRYKAREVPILDKPVGGMHGSTPTNSLPNPAKNTARSLSDMGLQPVSA